MAAPPWVALVGFARREKAAALSAVAFKAEDGAPMGHFKPVNALALASLGARGFIALERCGKQAAAAGTSLHHFKWDKAAMSVRSFPPEPATCLATVGDAFVIAGSTSGALFVWDADDGVLVAAPRCHHRAVKTVAVSNDGAIFATGGDDAVVHVWSLAHVLECGASTPPAEATPIATFAHHALAVTGVQFGDTFPGPDGVLASVSMDKCIHVHSVHAGQLLRSVRTAAPLTCVSVCACDSAVVAGGADGALYVLSLVAAPGGTTASAVRLVGHAGAVRAIAAVPGTGRVVSTCAGGGVRIWDAAAAARGDHGTDADAASAAVCVGAWNHAANAAATGGAGGGGAAAAEGVEASAVCCMLCPPALQARAAAAQSGGGEGVAATGGGGMVALEKYTSIASRNSADRTPLRLGACDSDDDEDELRLADDDWCCN